MMIRILSLVLLVAIGIKAAYAAEAERPNILYLYVDDMGWGSIGPNGQAARAAAGKPHVLTPNLDQLAAEGINFTRGYGCPVCSPARSSQQSGFHQGHTFADRNDPDNAKKAMRRSEVLIGDALSAADYATGYWGKWGFGGSKDLRDPTIQNVQTLPTSHGYQHVLAELHHVRAHTFFQPTLWSAPASRGAVGGLKLVPNSMLPYRGEQSYPVEPALHNHPEYPSTGYCDDAYAFAALDFVRAQSAKYKQTGQPFFALLAVQIPHAPFKEITRLPEWDRAYQEHEWFQDLPAQAQQWAAMITRIDAHFGNILDELESQGIADETLVVFQSDNGGPSGASSSVMDSNGGLRGHKGSVYEGGIRVPLVMRWPEKINRDSKLKAGSNSGRVVDVTDLLPTFCELAGTPWPIGIDGVSIAPYLTGEEFQRERDCIVHEGKRSQSIIQGNFKLIRSAGGSVTLYDLNTDHAEQHDIAAQHPDLVAELEERLLGERVDEPKGFAVTYHRWVGDDGDVTSEQQHWSDYRYSNDGITYLSDDGEPKLSWIATVDNAGGSTATARVDEDLAVLGLEITGQSAVQRLQLRPDVRLTGRNEIRVSENGHLALNGGTASSFRWVEVQSGGTLSGSGVIECDLITAGTISVPASAKGSSLRVAGNVRIGGMLQLADQTSSTSSSEGLLTVIEADRIEGSFSNEEVIAEDGRRFAIGYTPTTVTLAETR